MTVVAGFALALGGALVAVSPAHAADFPDVDSEAELNGAIAYAVANPSDPVTIGVSGDFSITSGITDLTGGSVTIAGNGHTISSTSISGAGFSVSNAAHLTLDGLAIEFYESGPVLASTGTPADPAASPTVVLNGVTATAGLFDRAVEIEDTTFSATDTTIHDSESGIAGAFSFGTISLQDVTVRDIVECGVEVVLSEAAVLTGDRLTIERAECMGLWIEASDTASASITNSLFQDNGAGIVIFNDSTGTIEISDSTVSGSTSAEGFAAFGFSGTTRLTNSTITGGLDSGLPAVTASVEDGDVVITHSTVTENAVSALPVLYAGGPCGCGGTGAILLDHTVVAGNPGTGAGVPDLLIDTDLDSASSVSWSLIGTVEPSDTVTLALVEDPSGHNLFDATTPIDPDLGALALNGGTTPNHLPDATSPVVNAGDPAFVAPPATDQRGFARISGGIVDIGSVEVQFTPSLVLSRTATAVGEQVSAMGTGFPADTTFTMVLNSTPVTLGTATSNASGALSFAFVVPTSVPAGAHTVTATLAGNVVGSAAITVTGLPDTGADVVLPGAIGAALLIAGFLLAAAARRRRA